jgi:hypothetical protein
MNIKLAFCLMATPICMALVLAGIVVFNMS